jgi:hypothetical protein
MKAPYVEGEIDNITCGGLLENPELAMEKFPELLQKTRGVQTCPCLLVLTETSKPLKTDTDHDIVHYR